MPRIAWVARGTSRQATAVTCKSAEFDPVLVVLWTHTVEGLSRNDFIIAAKIDRLA